ncbi:MAG: hypothetical protein CVV64_12005 [Candidatus Wallbacteria bacterium HGW-Wallbacteria-1]|uniref:Cache domain-containing protein n=1 Tax=Candidatus Wallbacteria bacterium HGW-Wallbacteria-1 TaxID=2013854 RepID=A0A2N1PNG8_9BACT|nr:MAG: hypothetical protein CVV64_12005 [Candidatus Wallbacteria bacterium HGW-Wallbacteria-1]
MNRKIIFTIFSALIALAAIRGIRYSASDAGQKDNRTESNFLNTTFSALDKARDQSVFQIKTYFNQLSVKAFSSIEDNSITSAFRIILQEKATPAVLEDLDAHFVTTYSDFYDLLFIDFSGKVFYSVRMEDDFNQNIFSGKLSRTALSKKLLERSRNCFVDFDYYWPSGEPAAFFAVSTQSSPEDHNQKTNGWMVFQLPHNRMNAIIESRGQMGRTGETYLANKSLMMLTDSRFNPESAVLRQKVDTASARKAFTSPNSHIISCDYRGIEVLSSCSNFEMMDTKWAVLAEIDEDEVLTNHFRTNIADFSDSIAEKAAYNPQNMTPSAPSRPDTSNLIRVDVNETVKAAHGTGLITHGVATCTCIIATFQNRFTFMSHISPMDEIYNSGFTPSLITENPIRRDALGALMRRISHYEIRPCEAGKINFHIIANHSRSLAGILNKLTAMGHDLSHIRFHHMPSAENANVIVTDSDEILIEWVTKNKRHLQNARENQPLSTKFRDITNYENMAGEFRTFNSSL